MTIRKGDKFLCTEDVTNTFGWVLFEKGKEYEVGIYDIIEQGSSEEQYIITNDEGYDECFYTDSFKRKNEIREEKLKKLGI